MNEKVAISALPVRHPWDLSTGQAADLQKKLAPLVRERRFRARLRLTAGADAAYLPEFDAAVAAAVLWSAAEGRILASTAVAMRAVFPYRTGLLTFREAPSVLAALELLPDRPQVYLFDGQGRAHPLGMGLAAHIGLWLDAPTIGCAKSRLVGEYGEVGPEAGDRSPMIYKGKTVGAVLRTRKGVRPVFVSPGHLMDTPGAVRTVLAACRGFRQPEPLRLAHQIANRARKILKENPDMIPPVGEIRTIIFEEN